MLLIYGHTQAAGQATAPLIWLTVVMLAAYAASALLDLARHNVIAAAARRVDRHLSARIARLRPGDASDAGERGVAMAAVLELDHIRGVLGGPAPASMLDLPLMPLSLGVLFLLHPLLGLFAAVSAAMLAGCVLTAERHNAARAPATALSGARRWALAARLGRQAGAPAAAAVASRTWFLANARLRVEQEHAAHPTLIATAAVRALRPALQSAILGLGVYLVATGACQPACVLAASVALARTLGPVEAAAGHWRGLATAHACARRLDGRLSHGRQPQRSAVVVRLKRAYASRARGAGARSMASGLRPMAE
jgi:ATP-binding cassette subfamily C protein